MWHLQTRTPTRQLVMATALTSAAGPLTFRDVAALWRTNADFRTFWSDALRRVPFEGFCWECPPLTAATMPRAFECVFVDSPSLAGTVADPLPFAEHFRHGETAVAFASLGADALLVAPCPAASVDAAHLARFVATAGPEQMSGLWQAVGKALEARLGDSPLWLSTAGLGVAWFHVRLDSRPKYYRYRAYAQEPGG